MRNPFHAISLKVVTEETAIHNYQGHYYLLGFSELQSGSRATSYRTESDYCARFSRSALPSAMIFSISSTERGRRAVSCL